jgi:hypothetical protein
LLALLASLNRRDFIRVCFRFHKVVSLHNGNVCPAVDSSANGRREEFKAYSVDSDRIPLKDVHAAE